MTLPKYTPYLNGDGGVKIGLSPISELEWLDIDHKFEEEISLKKNLSVDIVFRLKKSYYKSDFKTVKLDITNTLSKIAL